MEEKEPKAQHVVAEYEAPEIVELGDLGTLIRGPGGTGYDNATCTADNGVEERDTFEC